MEAPDRRFKGVFDLDAFEESAGRILESMAEAGRRQQRPAQFVIGRVLEVGEKVLRVFANGQELKTEDLWINETLLPGYCPQLKGTLNGTCSSHGGSVTTPVKESQLTRGKHALAKDDRVVLLTEDWQFYYVIAKVVQL